MKKCYKFVAMLMAFVIMAGSYVRPVCAYECKSKTDRPANSDLKAAYKESAVTSSSGYFYWHRVNTANDTFILHYKPSKEGYYMFYSTAMGCDPRGAIYKKTLLGYDWIASDDDSNSMANNSGNSRNFLMVSKLKKNQDYLLVSQLYGSGTGLVTANIDPYIDKKYSENGGTWVRDDGPSSNISRITYYTKEQAAIEFQVAFNNYLALVLGDTSYVKNFKESVDKNGVKGGLDFLMEKGILLYERIDTIKSSMGVFFSVAIPGEDYITLGEHALSAIFDRNKDNDKDAAYAIVEKFKDCGISMVAASNAAVKVEGAHGIKVVEYKSKKQAADYSIYDSYALTGLELNCGHWE